MKPPTKAQLARAGRKDRIIDVAREIAEVDGWNAVTVRRLADAIGFSQPVLYGHFPDGRDGIVRAVALDGFARFAAVLADAGAGAGADAGAGAGPPGPDQPSAGLRSVDAARGKAEGEALAMRERMRRLAERYLTFARQNPAVYEAMFSLPTDLAFATAATPEELLAGFAALAAVVGGDETRAEMLWSSLHGLADLDRHRRLRPGLSEERIGLLVELFVPERAG